MNSSSSSGNLRFEFGFGPEAARVQRDPGAPFRILVLADFSGRGQRALQEPLAARRIRAVDCDNQDAVLTSFEAALSLPMHHPPDQPSAVPFHSVDDFHPDQLLRRVPSLSQLQTARSLLESSATAAQGAQELERLLGVAPGSTTPASPATVAAPESSDDTLARLLGTPPKSAPSAPPQPSGGMDIQRIIRHLVGATGSTPPEPAGLDGLRLAAELELSKRLQAILHHPAFQALEGAWRSVDWLVRRCPDDERVKYSLLDVTLEELAGDLPGLHRLLRDQPPHLLVGNYTFGANSENLASLSGLAQIAASLDVTFLGAAHPQLANCDSFAQHPDPDDWQFPSPPEVAQAWTALRRSKEAASFRLAAPRFLLRQPYGPGSESIDSISFQEISDASLHESFLWANSAFLLALRYSQAFVEGEEPSGGEIDGLPLFRFTEAGEAAMKPCAEAWLTERAMHRLAAAGLVPVMSVKGRDAVLLPTI